MPPKTKDSKPAAVDPEAAAAEQKALMESELVTAVLRSRLGRSVVLEQLCQQLEWCFAKKAVIMLPCTLYVHNMRRYQAVGEKLAVENFSLTDELAKQKLTLQDINEFLTNELKARSLAAAQASADTACRALASSRWKSGNAETEAC